ncbi:methylated-DNA--[protein]-cysteine S-methyltransferase [Ningiella sp. W23]|uniref:methylated-DNA--[protein]-cysteine S-methyltransferase n=1 Tax=Ningiella sp. W23 TaxID=3023715 RepID=UPI003757BC65
MRESLYISELETQQGYVQIFAHNTAVVEIAFADESITIERIQQKRKENEISSCAKQQLQEYFAGKRQHFDFPLDASGTAFQKQVWAALMDVPFGHTASYLDIATAIGKPKACRAVGAANGKNPIAIVVPCHRIIGTNGKLTGYAGGMSRKAFLLDLESRA